MTKLIIKLLSSTEENCYDLDRLGTDSFQICVSICICGPASSVGIATDYGLDGPGIESRWRRDFPPVQTGPEPHPASCTMGTRSFPGVKYGRGVLLTTHPLLVPWSWKSRAIHLPTLWACNGNTLPLYWNMTLWMKVLRPVTWWPNTWWKPWKSRHAPTLTCDAEQIKL